MIGKIILCKGRIQAKLDLGCRQARLVSCCIEIQLVNGSWGTATAGTFCDLYPHLCLETVFPALKLAQNCYLHYNINIFFLKTANLIINWLHPHHLTKNEGKGTKISIFKLFGELGKIWKCNSGFSKIPNSHLSYELGKTWKYTQPETNISKFKC